MSEACRHCGKDDGDIVDFYDGYGSVYYHQKCQDEDTERFRAFLDNPLTFRTSEDRIRDNLIDDLRKGFQKILSPSDMEDVEIVLYSKYSKRMKESLKCQQNKKLSKKPLGKS